MLCLLSCRPQISEEAATFRAKGCRHTGVARRHLRQRPDAVVIIAGCAVAAAVAHTGRQRLRLPLLLLRWRVQRCRRLLRTLLSRWLLSSGLLLACGPTPQEDAAHRPAALLRGALLRWRRHAAAAACCRLSVCCWQRAAVGNVRRGSCFVPLGAGLRGREKRGALPALLPELHNEIIPPVLTHRADTTPRPCVGSRGRAGSTRDTKGSAGQHCRHSRSQGLLARLPSFRKPHRHLLFVPSTASNPVHAPAHPKPSQTPRHPAAPPGPGASLLAACDFIHERSSGASPSGLSLGRSRGGGGKQWRRARCRPAGGGCHRAAPQAPAQGRRCRCRCHPGGRGIDRRRHSLTRRRRRHRNSGTAAQGPRPAQAGQAAVDRLSRV